MPLQNLIVRESDNVVTQIIDSETDPASIPADHYIVVAAEVASDMGVDDIVSGGKLVSATSSEPLKRRVQQLVIDNDFSKIDWHMKSVCKLPGQLGADYDEGDMIEAMCKARMNNTCDRVRLFIGYAWTQIDAYDDGDETAMPYDDLADLVALIENELDEDVLEFCIEHDPAEWSTDLAARNLSTSDHDNDHAVDDTIVSGAGEDDWNQWATTQYQAARDWSG